MVTGGIGEHAPAVREEIWRRLTSLKPPKVLVVPADEAVVMDHDAPVVLAAEGRL